MMQMLIYKCLINKKEGRKEFNMLETTSKVVVITGASSGISEATQSKKVSQQEVS